MKITALLLCLGLALSAAGCAEEEQQPLTWQEFQDQAYQEDGVWVVNGDEPAETIDQLADYYRAYLDSFLVDGIGSTQQALIVNRVGGRDDKWSTSAAQNITYCVSRSSFGTSRYNTVVSAMSSAASAWESAARVNFVHNSSLDNNCNSNTSGVVFDVRQVNTNQYLARAFFPSSSRRNRNVLIASSAFGNIAPYTMTGILRHELGHTLGFRHEHTRPEAGTCFENTSWRALTAYDSSSVMHYPQCNGTNNGDLVLTALDRSGASSLYP
jgi:serralysin